MAYTDPRTVLPQGLVLSWTITLVLAPPTAVKAGGRFDKRVLWGTYTCDQQMTGAAFMNLLHKEAARRASTPQHLTTVLEIDVKAA